MQLSYGSMLNILLTNLFLKQVQMEFVKLQELLVSSQLLSINLSLIFQNGFYSSNFQY